MTWPDPDTGSSGVSADWPAEVLAFWFGELSPKAWFEKSDAIDARIRGLFLRTYDVVRGGEIAALASTADAALAALIVLDQFPRNMFRGTARAFESDAHAMALARVAVGGGLDMQVDGSRRLFFYLPFEHSESVADQDRSVELFERLGDEQYLRYALAHRDVVVRFGRFPHRNEILGRQSTAEELAFLAQPGSSF